MGILFAFIALVAWGFGDFLIQRSARLFGDWVALFYVTAFATIVLLPFVYRDLLPLFQFENSAVTILLLASVMLVLAALLDFEALRVGKISVIEPIYAFEVFVTAAIGTFVVKEVLTSTQMFLVAALIVGIVMVSIRSFTHLKKAYLERGVWYAAFATLGMGFVNVLFGLGARVTNPLVINWFTSAFLAFVCLIALAMQSRLKDIVKGIKKHPLVVGGAGVFDNLAWVSYAFATLYIPIAVAISISEAYIALAAVLGITMNKEKLGVHQSVGLMITVMAAVLLAYVTEL